MRWFVNEMQHSDTELGMQWRTTYVKQRIASWEKFKKADMALGLSVTFIACY